MSYIDAFLHAGGRSAAKRYWLCVAGLTLFNTMLLGITSAAAGLTLTAYIEGSREVVLLNMVALTLLFWPASALAVKGLRERRKWAWWGVCLHAVAVFIFMLGFFGKPFDITAASGLLKVLPTLLFLVLASWLIAEFLLIRRQAVVDAPTA